MGASKETERDQREKESESMRRDEECRETERDRSGVAGGYFYPHMSDAPGSGR